MKKRDLAWRRLLPALLAAWMAAGIAQPNLEGRTEPLNIASPALQRIENGVLWQKEVFDQPGVSFFRLRFAAIVPGNAKNIAIVLRNRVNNAMLQIPAAEFLNAAEYWTGTLPGSYALLQVVSTDGTVPQGFSFTVAEVGFEARGARVLSQQDPLNPKDRPVAHYRNDASMMAAARSVAKLRFVRNGRLYSCTGFMISDELLLTNEHCVNTAETCRSTIAVFGYEYDANAVLQPGEEFRCAELVDAHAGLDYALLRFSGDPGAKSRWGTLSWEGGVQAKRTSLYLVQHPDGLDKRIARDDCAVSSPKAVGKIAGDETDFGHLCDTVTGSSGSPLLNLAHRVVGLHHMGFQIGDNRWARENRAVQIKRVIDRIANRL